MTGKKSVAWSVSVNLGNNESLGLVVTDEVGDKDEARDVFAFGIGQLLGVAKGADEKTARLLQDFVSRFVQEEEAKPAVRDEKEPTVRLEAPPAKEPWTQKITKSSWERAAKQDAAALQQRATLAKEAMIAKSGGVADQDAKPEKTPTIEEQAAEAVAQCIKPPATAPDPAPSAPPTPEASAPAAAVTAPLAPKTAPPEGFSLCVECGEAVPANQAKLSQLFQSKTLCKKCMEAP